MELIYLFTAQEEKSSKFSGNCLSDCNDPPSLAHYVLECVDIYLFVVYHYV